MKSQEIVSSPSLGHKKNCNSQGQLAEIQSHYWTTSHRGQTLTTPSGSPRDIQALCHLLSSRRSAELGPRFLTTQKLKQRLCCLAFLSFRIFCYSVIDSKNIPFHWSLQYKIKQLKLVSLRTKPNNSIAATLIFGLKNFMRVQDPERMTSPSRAGILCFFLFLFLFFFFFFTMFFLNIYFW